MPHYLPPHGGVLKNLIAPANTAESLQNTAIEFPSITLSRRQQCDLELLLNGGFSPLTGFMNQADYDQVVAQRHLTDGTLWPMPIVLDVPSASAEKFSLGQQLALRDSEGFMLAVLTIEDIWAPDKDHEARSIYGTESLQHPGVYHLYHDTHSTYIGGKIEGIQLPMHFDFEDLWYTPEELRRQFEKMGWKNIVAFHTSNPMHRLQREITLNVAKEVQAHILIHPIVGSTKPGDTHYFSRVRCYREISRYYPHRLSILSLLPLSMRIAGPVEALWHAIIQQNYGCSHFIVGPNHASPDLDRKQHPWLYDSEAAMELLDEHVDELEIEIVKTPELGYSPSDRKYLPVVQLAKENKECLDISAKQLKEILIKGGEIPAWHSYPEVISELQKIHPTRNKLGFTLFFTGLSGSGKSTLARIIYAKLVESGGRAVTLLDGDIVRLNLSSELGFSKEHRNLNINRIGFVANEITKNGGVAICAPIAPYSSTRRQIRRLIEEHGAFIEVHVSTPLETCESRDRKGLYAKARKGVIPEFTGVSDPYEVPEHAELVIDTSDCTPMEAAQDIFLFLLREGFVDTE
ncbi:bifunctional sulfate adenylyltransferase/adenylylsulfate kinase [Pseudomonadota bacterium]